MTLIELKYVVAVAHERHFGRAAAACYVSQPTLSVAIKKLEEELGVQIFERDPQEVKVTSIGAQIIVQAQQVLAQAQDIRVLAKQGKDPFRDTFRLGFIYTIAPYILPLWMPQLMATVPHMPLILREDFTNKLLVQLKQGELDCIVLAEPFDTSGLVIRPLYEESFVLALPNNHIWTARDQIAVSELKNQTVLLLGPGHCLRDQILAVFPNLTHFSLTTDGIQKTFEGSSLETICYMVASGLGITVLPASSLSILETSPVLRYVRFMQPEPGRRVVMAVRKSFNRQAVLEVLVDTLRQCQLPGIRQLT